MDIKGYFNWIDCKFQGILVTISSTLYSRDNVYKSVQILANKVLIWLRRKWEIDKLPLQANQRDNINGLVQDCSNSIVNALELLQSWTKSSIL